MWKATLIIVLKRLAPRADQPGAIRLLSRQQERDAASVDRVGCRHSPYLMKRNQGGSRGVGVAIHCLRLSPSSVWMLHPNQITLRRANLLLAGTGRVECPEAENPVFRVPSGRLDQPAADNVEPLGNTLLLLGNAPFLQGAQRQIGRREVTVLRGWPMARRPPMVQIFVTQQ